MDPQHKDELEQNDLFNFLFGSTDGQSNIRRGAGKYGTKVLLIGVLVFGGLYLYKYFGQRTLQAEITQQDKLAAAVTSVDFDGVAKAFKGEAVGLLSVQYTADALLAEGLASKGEGKDADAKKSLEFAVGKYQGLIGTKGVHRVRVLAARLGLGVAYTGLSDLVPAERESYLTKAINAYRAVEKDGAEDFDHLAKEAGRRIKGLDLLKEKVVFAAEPVVVPKTEDAGAGKAEAEVKGTEPRDGGATKPKTDGAKAKGTHPRS